MAISAQAVKQLKELTNCGMMDCKRALEETNGDVDAAIKNLREKGLAKAAKKSGRIAAEGLVYTKIDEAKKVGVVVEINVETDFAAKTDRFIEFVELVANTIIDNDVADVSLTSMFLQCVTGAVLRDTVIDNGAGGAPWGTAAIHLQLAKDVLIENVEIKNMPHTNVSDECGIDFETDVENCIIRGCSFENNAGAAIEFLCNFEMSPMAVSRNVVIEQCDFVHNNWAVLYNNPAQILVQIWQHDNCPSVTVRDCRFSNPDGVVEIGGDGILDLFQTGNVVLNATAVSAAM